MNQARFALFKIKDGKEQQLRNWLSILHTTRRGEALQTLKNEHVDREAGFIVHVDSQPMYACFASGDERPVDLPPMLIDYEHRAIFQDCLERPPYRGELGYDLKVT